MLAVNGFVCIRDLKGLIYFIQWLIFWLNLIKFIDKEYDSML